MTLSEIAEEIIQRVPAADAASLYGLNLNRQGFCCCPFHGEKTASLKIFPGTRGFYCFGCGAGGNVINLVEKLFNLKFMDAVKKINDDFHLGLNLKHQKPKLYQYRESQKRQKEQELKQAELLALKISYNSALERYANIQKDIERYKPASPDNAPDPRFIAALQSIESAEHELEIAESRLASYGTNEFK